MDIVLLDCKLAAFYFLALFFDVKQSSLKIVYLLPIAVFCLLHLCNRAFQFLNLSIVFLLSLIKLIKLSQITLLLLLKSFNILFADLLFRFFYNTALKHNNLTFHLSYFRLNLQQSLGKQLILFLSHCNLILKRTNNLIKALNTNWTI